METDEITDYTFSVIKKAAENITDLPCKHLLLGKVSNY